MAINKLKLVIIFLSIIFLFGNVSALAIDDKVLFHEEGRKANYGYYEINDTLFWFFNNKPVKTIELIENDYGLFNAWKVQEIELFRNSKLFDKTDYYDIKQEKDKSNFIKSEDHTYRQWINKTRLIEDVSCNSYSLNVSNSSSEYCSEWLNNSYIETYEGWSDWEEYNFQSMQIGIYQLRTDVIRNSLSSGAIEWVDTNDGHFLDKWLVWFDRDWSFKAPLNITEITGNSFTNYSTLIYVNFTEDTNSEANTNFSDLLFTDPTQTAELGFWIENKTDGSFAWVWVNTPTLTASSSVIPYMYYGNEAHGISDSNRSNVFLSAVTDAHGRSLTTSTSLTDLNGFKITIGSSPVLILGATTVPGDTSTRLLIKTLGASTLTTESIISKIAILSHPYPLTSSTGYFFEVDASGGTYTRKWIQQASFPYNGANLVYTDGVRNDALFSDYWFDIESITSDARASSEPTFSFGAQEQLLSVSTILISPEDGFNQTSIQVTFNYSSIPSETNLTNTTLSLWNETDNTLILTNFTTLSGNESVNTTFYNNLSQGNYLWNAETCGEIVDCSSAENNNSFVVHTTPANVNLTDPSGIIVYLENNSNINASWTITEGGQNLSEHITNCSFTYNNQITYLDINTCVNVNTTIFNYSKGVNNASFTAVDEFNLSYTDYTNWSLVVDSYTQGANYQNIGEGSDVTFNLTINYNLSHTGTAKLHLNGNSYDPDSIVTLSGINFYEKVINMEDGFGNATGNTLDWYWIYNVTDYNDYINTTAQNLTIYSVEIDNCSSYGELILNMSLQDEETKLSIPGVNESSNVEIDLEISGVDNSSLMWQYFNTYTNETNPQVCMPLNILNFSSYNIDFTIGYEAEDHVKEFYYLDNGTLDQTKEFNSYTDYNINLSDLLTIDSTTFLFNFFDKDGLAVENAIVHTLRRYLGQGEFFEVERSKQDNNGKTHIHVVEEDVIYRFMITQNGNIIFTSEEYSALCEVLPCSITLTETGEFNELPDDYSLINGTGIILNNATERTTTYIYSMNEQAEIEFILYKQEFNGSTTKIDNISSTSSAGTLILSIPLHAGNVSYFTAINKDDLFIRSQWVDLDELNASNFFGSFLAVFIGILILLTLVLISVTEKSGTIVVLLLGLFLVSALGLIDLTLSTGQNLLIYMIVAGGILIFKITRKKS